MLSFMAIAIVAILGMIVFVSLDSRQQLQNYMLRGGMFGAENLVNALEDYYRQQGSWAGVETFLADWNPAPAQTASAGRQGRGMGNGMMGAGMGMGMMNRRLRLADGQGRLLFDNRSLAAVEGSLSDEQRQLSILLSGDTGQTVGYLLIDEGLALDTTSTLFRRITSAALRAGLLAGVLALALGLLLASRLIHPVLQLTQAAQKMSAGDLSQRVPVQGHDELAMLAETFNHMSATLAQSEERRKAMTADIAHELRTPLSVQRAHLEALQDGIYPLTAENLQPVLDQTELLARLVDDLRTLALADAGELRLEKRTVSLPVLVGDMVERFASAAEARRVRLVYSLPPGCSAEVLADADRLAQILNNILANALRYTPEGGKIELALTCSAPWAELSVRDSGPGIPPEALASVFERFYRADRSRSREEGGTGLGLAIARQLALAHGGDLLAANHAEGGAVFILRLPL